jgi:hypothetical protein
MRKMIFIASGMALGLAIFSSVSRTETPVLVVDNTITKSAPIDLSYVGPQDFKMKWISLAPGLDDRRFDLSWSPVYLQGEEIPGHVPAVDARIRGPTC